MSGLDAIRHLRGAGSAAVLVVFTASGLNAQNHEALAAGAAGVLLKPYREADLLQRIGAFLGIRYAYDIEEGQPSSGGVEEATGNASLPELLKAVPANLIEQLRDAVTQARTARIEQLATQVSEYSDGAAIQIRTLAKDFRYDSLASALEAAMG